MERIRSIAAIAVLLFVLSPGVSGYEQGQTRKTDCDAPASPSQVQAPDAEISLGSTDDPRLSGQKFTTRRVSPKVAVFTVIPRDTCEVKNVFQVLEGTTLEPIESDLVNIQDLVSPLITLGDATSEETQTAAGFSSFLKRCDAGYVVVIGHGKDGMLRFPDGSSSSLSEMARQCAAEGKICVFPTCVLHQEPGQDPGLDSLDSYICLKNPAEPLGTLRSFVLRDRNRISLAELVAKIKGYVFPL